MTTPDRPIVWAFCNGRYPWGDEQWAAVTDDGRTVAMHISSARHWGIDDVGPVRKAAAYQQVVGTTDVDYRVVPEGERLPEHVREAIARRIAARKDQDDAPQSEG